MKIISLVRQRFALGNCLRNFASTYFCCRQSWHGHGCAMLELSHIQYMVGDKRVLQNVSARFPAGHITGIIGPNGAGKTSLLRVAAGLAQVSAGHCYGAWRFCRCRLACQKHSLYAAISICRLAAFSARHCGIGLAAAQFGRGGKRKAR